MGYRSKYEWATARATAIARQITQLSEKRFESQQWENIRQRERVLTSLRNEEARFRSMAQRYARLGQ